MRNDWQSSGELEAHYDDGTPLVAARRWLTVVLRVGDLSAAWPAVDHELRLVLAQEWLWRHRDDPDLDRYDLEAVASALAEEDPLHELWPELAESLLADLTTRWAWLDLEQLGVAGRPVPVAFGYELVTFTARGSGAGEDSLPLLMRYRDGHWLVAGLGSDGFPAPGWPRGR